MKAPSFWFRKYDPELGEFIAGLTRDSLQALIWTIGGVMIAWLFAVGLRWPELLFWQFWAVFLTFLAISRLALFLLGKRPSVAGPVWLAGMALTNLLMVLLFRRPEIIVFFVFVPLIAVAVMGWQAGVASEAIVLLILWGLYSSGLSGALNPFFAVTAVGSLVCVLLGWVNRQTLLEAISRSVHYSEAAHDSLEEARQHRAQLFLALKNLDLAYYRLERANAALVSAWKQAEEAEQFKSEFVTYVSHEMRTPLNLISGFSETILTAPESYGATLPGPYREDVSKIWRSAEHLLKLVDDVIDLAKVNVGRISLSREPVDLNGLLLEAVGMVKDYIQARGLEVQVQLAQDLPPVWIDRLRILQVMLNLLVNAVRFTERGWIRIETVPQDGQAVVKVSDSGMGIPAEEIPKVFDEFHTSSKTGEVWHGGGGLGLPISKKLVELHQGQMGLHSQPGRGSTFWFTLPLAQPDEDALAHLRPYTAEHFRPKASERILVVAHRDQNVVPLLQRYLDNTRVLGSKNLEEAKAIALENKAAAVLVEAGQAGQCEGDWIMISSPLPDWHRAFGWPAVANVLRKPVTSDELWKAILSLDRNVERVLIVDDEPEMVDLLRRMLRTDLDERGLMDAGDGSEAIRQMRASPPDLVLLDLLLPDIDGREVLRRMEADPELAGIPVIIISGNMEDYSLDTLHGPIEISKNGGFQFGEIIRSLEPLLAALAPGWSSPIRPD